jgi:hypothetical protein
MCQILVERFDATSLVTRDRPFRMSMHRAPRVGLVLCAIALLLAGCSGSDGSGGTSSPVPRGLGGPGGSHHNGQQHKHHGGKSNKPGKHHHKGPASSSSPSSHPTDSTTPPRAHSSHPVSSTSSQPSGQPHTSSTSAPHPTLPTVVVTPHTGLSGVQTVTVEGFHFKPNTLLAVAECHDRGQHTNLPDCNIDNVITYAPGAKVHSDANGHVGPLQITVRKTFKAVNCGTQKCLLAISEPALQPDPADEGDQYIHFA